MRRYFKPLLKLTISIALIVLVIRHIDTEKLLAILKRSDPIWLVGAFVIFNLSKILSAVRLNLYFKACRVHLTETRNLMLYYLGMFYNLFLPGGIGGDGYKIYLLKKRFDTSVGALVQATLLDRINGLVALLFLAGILFSVSGYVDRFPALRPIALLVVLAVYPLFVWIHLRLFRPFADRLALTSLLGLGVQLLQLLSALCIVYALPQHVPVYDYLFLFLLSSVVAVLPLTVGGVGAREFTFLYGLNLLGYDPAGGVAFSVLFFAVTVLSSAIGILFLHKKIL